MDTNLIAGDNVTLKGADEAPGEEFLVQAVPPGATNAMLLGRVQDPGRG